MARRTIIFFLLISILVLGGCGKERPQMRSLCMTGVVDTLVVPDLTVWTVRMNDLDPLLVGAKEANDAKLEAVLEALEKIEMVDGSFRNGPARIERQFRRCDDGINRFSHFSVRRTVTFQQDDPAAVEKALDLAQGKAKSLAAHADMSIGAILSVNVHEDLDRLRRNRHRNDSGTGISGPQAQVLSTQVRVNFETYWLCLGNCVFPDPLGRS